MSVYLFIKLFHLLVLLLLMCCTLCGHRSVSGETQAPDSNTVELFKKERGESEISINLKPDGEKTTEGGEKKVTVKNYYSPVIVSEGDSFIVLAGVNRTVKSNEGKTNNIVTTYIQSETLFKNIDDVKNTASNWETQYAVKNEAGKDTDEVVKGLLAVAKNNKTYLLLVNFSKKAQADPANSLEFKLGFAVRTVNEEDPAGKKIKWIEKKLTFASVSDKLKKQFQEVTQIDDFVFSGSAFLTDKEKIVFALVIGKLEEKMSALIHLKNDEELEVLYTETENNCHPHFFPWKSKIIMVPDSCLPNEKEIKELSNVEGTWSASKENLFRYYEFLKDKQDFVTIRNGIKEILLFTEHKTQGSEQPAKTNVNLWMSDGNRLHKIGKITVDKNTVTQISFLFANDRLFFLDQQLESNEIKSIKLTYLEEQSTTATTIINAWSSTDAKISTLCSGKKDSKVFCNIDGPVGFLFDNYSSDNWNDEYHYANAIVTDGEKVPEGIKLKGKEGKATWTVFKEKEDQPYNFADSGLTLVATVKIDSHNREAGNSLLGLVLNDGNKGFGLWCGKEKNFIVKIKEEDALLKINQKECSEGKTYIITFVFEKDKNLQIYVDGEELAVLDKDKITITASESIKHFYFGADGQTQRATSDVTITNVLLYNWPFKEEENKKLQQMANANKEREAREKIGSDDNNQPENRGSATENDGPPTIPDTQASTENDTKDAQSSPPPTTEDSAARVGVVGVLCFTLFGVFTLLGRYVY